MQPAATQPRSPGLDTNEKPPGSGGSGGGRDRISLLIWQSVNRIDPVLALFVVWIGRPAFDADQLTVLEIVHGTGFDQIDAAAVLVLLVHRRIANAPAVVRMEADQLALHPAIVGGMREARLGRDVRIRAAVDRFFPAPRHGNGITGG